MEDPLYTVLGISMASFQGQYYRLGPSMRFYFPPKFLSHPNRKSTSHYALSPTSADIWIPQIFVAMQKASSVEMTGACVHCRMIPSSEKRFFIFMATNFRFIPEAQKKLIITISQFAGNGHTQNQRKRENDKNTMTSTWLPALPRLFPSCSILTIFFTFPFFAFI